MPRIMKLHRYIDHESQMTPIDFQVTRGCFQVYVTHKFRAAIGKTKLVRDGEKVLVGISGGPSSCALLHLIQEGLSQRAHKKLRFKPGLLFIEEGQVVGQSLEERKVTLTRIHSLLRQSGFPYHLCKLADSLDLERVKTLSACQSNHAAVNKMNQSAMDINTAAVNKMNQSAKDINTSAGNKMNQSAMDMNTCINPVEGDKGEVEKSGHGENCCDLLEMNREAEKLFAAQLGSIKSISGKEDFVRALRHRLLLEFARQHGYSKVMLGNTGSQLAVRLLTDISTGRGMQAAMETAFADRRNTDMMFLRPLRDFSSKEIAMYNNLHRLECVFIPSLTTMGDVGASIEHLTEAFVTGLQAEYPSTVSNIMRTGEKLDSSSAVDIESHCALCQGPLDTDVGMSSALAALRFSLEISTMGKSNGKRCIKGDNSVNNTNDELCSNGVNYDAKVECCGESDGSCRSSTQLSVPDEGLVLQTLCYGCRIVAMEMDDVNSLPEFVMKDVAWRNRRSVMKAEIQDFLLDDR
ncbi:hypothetical protein DPMN_174382 [Dreissena polymorpha]|uniref:Cytoplasmic tRNA 2-thiolation protein 2 n=1 Tax=Dreissena polymorpha TaxID=45954 RepID=A0A9D4E4M0_DREPO|nr:hypothetical protein DPMN_174382 [Dreissena polymorpha]